jgi:hypothetical protein
MKTRKRTAMAVLLAALAFTACKPDPEPAHTHNAGTWVTTQPPTCTEAGIKELQCTVDHFVLDTQTIPALGHDWNANAETITANATETENSIRAITCKRDKSHTKDEEVNEYATGTAGLEYTLITTGDYANTYQVSRGTFEGAVLHIPAYHREPTDVDYIPVTTISGFGRTSPPIIPSVTTLTTVTFAAENQLKTISNQAFSRCTSLTSITILASVTSIGSGAFDGCTSLASITIPEGVTTIDSFAFRSCSNLTSITIPTGVMSIGNYAFTGCASFTSITIPAGITSIGEYAFTGCTSLTSVTCLPTTPPTLEGWADVFNDTHESLVIKVPSASVTVYQTATNWSSYGSRIRAIE